MAARKSPVIKRQWGRRLTRHKLLAMGRSRYRPMVSATVLSRADICVGITCVGYSSRPRHLAEPAWRHGDVTVTSHVRSSSDSSSTHQRRDYLSNVTEWAGLTRIRVR